MNAPIYYVGGSKGGVGKSKVSFALVDYLTEQGNKILLLETEPPPTHAELLLLWQMQLSLCVCCRECGE